LTIAGVREAVLRDAYRNAARAKVNSDVIFPRTWARRFSQFIHFE